MKKIQKKAFFGVSQTQELAPKWAYIAIFLNFNSF